MELRRKNKISADFNMASMTDLIFLLLVFFILTSNFASSSGHPVNLPTDKNINPMAVQKVRVTVHKDLKIFINEIQVTQETLEPELRRLLPPPPYPDGKPPQLVLAVDKEVQSQYLVDALSAASKVGWRVSLATEKK